MNLKRRRKIISGHFFLNDIEKLLYSFNLDSILNKEKKIEIYNNINIIRILYRFLFLKVKIQDINYSLRNSSEIL